MVHADSDVTNLPGEHCEAERRQPRMTKRFHFFLAAAWLILNVSLLTGCERMMATPISRVLDNPRDYDGKTVTIRGEVTEVFSLLVVKYFVIKDSTGEITVITEKLLPRQGTTIAITGTVQEAFSLGDRQIMVIVEEEKR